MNKSAVVMARTRVIDPLREFVRAEAAGGIALLGATIIALAWANSPVSGSYLRLWASELPLGTGPLAIHADLRHLVNEGLMAVFFFVVGLEIKRELATGVLRDRRAAALPAVAAAGGVLLPALVFTAIAGGGASSALEGPLKPGGLPASTAGTASPASHADVVRQVLPSVVLIRTPSGSSSGVVLDRSGHILTTAHVGKATALHVQAAGDPAPRTAHLVGSYPPEDLAVIRADDPCSLQPAWFGDSDKAQAGEVVLAVSKGPGLSGSVTEGIISATGRVVTGSVTKGGDATTLREAIQSSAPISPGNSGGALVNTSGQVIGIPTLTGSPQDGPYAEGIGFAIPSNLARNTASKIIASAHVTNTLRATFGAQTAAFTGASPGGSAPNCASAT